MLDSFVLLHIRFKGPTSLTSRTEATHFFISYVPSPLCIITGNGKRDVAAGFKFRRQTGVANMSVSGAGPHPLFKILC